MKGNIPDFEDGGTAAGWIGGIFATSARKEPSSNQQVRLGDWDGVDGFSGIGVEEAEMFRGDCCLLAGDYRVLVTPS